MNAPATADFSAFFLADTSPVDITLPNGEPMLFNGQQVVVHLYGPSTERHTKAKDELDREVTKRMMSAMGKRGKKETEDKDADVKFLTAVTERVDNFPFPGGVSAMYREARLRYIADQVRAHLGDLGNFFPGAAKT